MVETAQIAKPTSSLFSLGSFLPSIRPLLVRVKTANLVVDPTLFEALWALTDVCNRAMFPLNYFKNQCCCILYP